MLNSNYIYRVYHVDAYTLWNIISQQRTDKNTICLVFYPLNFLKPINVQNIHLLPQYTPNNDVEQIDRPSGLLLLELLFLPHRPFNASSTVPSASNLSRILVCCYSWWRWCTKFNPLTSSSFNSILHFPITLQ